MGTLGPNDLKNISLPSAWDNTELSRLRLRDGTTYETLLRDIDDALTIVNGQMQGGFLSNLISMTTEPAVEYRTGVSNGFEDHTEYTKPDPKRAKTTGHMLPIKKIDRALGWTADFLEEARQVQIDADIASMIDDARNAYEKMVLTRLFKIEEETGAAYGLGSGGVSVPFASGAVGTIPWTPPQNPARMINPFSSTHTHYLRLDGISQTNIEAAVAHLWEHGADGPFDLIASLADLAAWQNTTNVTGFKMIADPLIQYGVDNDLALVNASTYQGVIQTKYGVVRLWANGRIPTTFYSVVKTYGANDQRNPLRIRYDELFGFGVKLRSEFVSSYPLYGAIGVMKLGAGVGIDRSAAVLVRNAGSGDYTTPTIA
jgi:hypothetical protein